MAENNIDFPELPTPRNMLISRPDCNKILNKLSKEELLFLFNRGKHIFNTSYNDIMRYRREMACQREITEMERSRLCAEKLRGEAWMKEHKKWERAYGRLQKMQRSELEGMV